MSSPVLWGPNNVASNLESGIAMSNGAAGSILSGATDPTAVATGANQGSLYMSTSTGSVYKKNDNGTTTNWSNVLASQVSYAPTISTLVGSGSYTKPANCSFVILEMVGGGGGGSGSDTGGTAGSNGTAGTTTTFGAASVSGGVGGLRAGVGGGGGSTSGSIGTLIVSAYGQQGGPASAGLNNYPTGGGGGSAIFGGAGGGGSTGGGGAANGYGSGGGGGAGGSTSGAAGSGGGAGGYAKYLVTGAITAVSYSVGAAGLGGAAGTSGFTGGNGFAGTIIITEFYTTPGGAAGSGITRTITSISSPTTAAAVLATDYVYLVSGTTTLTLPTAVSNTNLYTVKNTGVATVTVAFTGVQTGDGNATLSLTPNTSLDLISDNANWRIV